MARKFGDYIHLHWENYYNHGTFRNREKGNNYNVQLFNTHYKNIKSAVKNSSLKKTEREKIATEYNKHNENAWEFFSSLNKSNFNHRNILDYILHEINSTWTPAFRAQIIDDLQWDDTRKTFIYSPSQNMLKKYNTASATYPPFVLSSNAGFHYFKTAKDYIEDKALLYLKNLEASSGSTPVIDADKQALEGVLDKITKAESTLTSLNLTEKKLGQLIKTGDKTYQGVYNRLIKKFLEIEVVEQLNSIREKYISAEEINRQIQAAIAEICGNIAAEMSAEIAVDEVKKTLKEALSVGRTGSEVEINNKGILSLNAKVIEDDLLRNLDLAKIVKKAGKSKDGKIRYEFTDIGQSRAQKRDVSIIVDSQDYGISVKNTDLINALSEYDAKKLGLHASTISLQNSSLMLYLMGIEQDNPGWGTHYLNVLTKHKDLNSMTQLQQQALQSLKLYVLYSALTGQGQLRGSANAARILAIYDKAKNTKGGSRVRLYDMSDIILAIEKSEFTQGVKFSPELNSTFLIKNDYEPKIDGRNPVDIRLTKVLLEARHKNIGASLYTAWLRDSMKSF